MKNYQFINRDKVRDYECDIQGVVNNSVYQNYLEHARHEFLLDMGVDFAKLANDGINLVVIKAELEYKKPLTPGDRYWIGTTLEQTSKIRFAFLQDIYKEGDDKPALVATITGTSLNERGRPIAFDTLSTLIKPSNNT